MVKQYRLYGVNTAVELLRPGAKWEITDNYFSLWEDPRPCPSMDEIHATVKKIKEFEDSIATVWLPEQIQQQTELDEMVESALANS